VDREHGAFKKDLHAMEKLVADKKVDLYATSLGDGKRFCARRCCWPTTMRITLDNW